MEPPQAVWADPYRPIYGHSALRNEYKVPDTRPKNSDTTASDTSAVNDTSAHLCSRASSSATNPDVQSYIPCRMPEAEQEDPEDHDLEDYDPEYATYLVTRMVSRNDEDDLEDYDPEYATYLLASMISQAEKEEMAEIEEMTRIRDMLAQNRGWDNRIALSLSERRLGIRLI